MEYGLHSSLVPTKARASQPATTSRRRRQECSMAAVGPLYRYGYFTQRLSSQGAQEATYEAQNFYKLPYLARTRRSRQLDDDHHRLPGRTLWRASECQVGRTTSTCFDADFEANSKRTARSRTTLYGGDWENWLGRRSCWHRRGIRALQAGRQARRIPP